MNLFDLYENREPYQQAIDKLEQRRIEDLEAKMDDCARRGDKEGFQKCKAERDSYHKIKETRDTTEKDSQGHVTGFSHEGDWKKIPKNKAGRPVDPRGEVTHLSDLARREAERAAQDDVAEGAGEFLYKKLRPSQYGGVDVVGFKQAPRNSVLSGQVLKHFIDSYETEEEALKAHPDAEGYSNKYTDPQVSLRHLPGEDDPVAGGMYPDDIDEQGMAEGAESSPVAGAIVNRIMRQRPDLLTQYGPKLISAAVDEVADYVGDVDEIGSSDVSGWVNQVERMLKENPPEAFGEAGIGQDLVTPQQRVQGAKSQKQTPTGKVVDTVKQAGKWLAGRGGPGREGPTYEGADDIEDRGEYDREGDMAKDNIHTIVRNAKELESILSDNDNLPEWVQDKLANIKGMMTAVSEYMQTQHERDHEEMSGEEGITIAEKLKGLPAKKLGSARDLGKSVRKFRAQRGLEERNAAQKKNSKKVTEYISMGSDKNYSEAEPYKNYQIYVRKKPFGNTGMYTAHTEIDRKEFMGNGPSQAAAVQAVRDRIDFVLNAQQKVTGSSTIDFNVKFATDLLADPKQTFYAKLENVMGQPKLIIASADIASDPELLAAGDFKRSALRNRVSDKGQTTAPPGIPLTAKSLRAGNWIANGRYTIGNETADRDGNRVFDISYHSTAHTKSDKLHLNQPAFTLGTAREVDEAGSKQDNKQVDIKASMLLKRARAAHPLAQSDAEALAMYFLDKEESDVDRLDQVNDREDRMIDRLDQVEQDLQRQIDKLQGHEKLKEGPDLINMSDLQFYKELLAVLIIPVAGLGAAAWNRAQNALKLYRAEDVITALNKKGITVDRATLGQIKPLLLKLEQAIDVDRDGDAAKELAKRIQQTVTWGKLKQTPVQPAAPVQGRDEPGMAEAANPAQQAAIAIAMKRAGKKPKSVDEESYTGVMQSQGITDPKLLEVACKIDAFAKTIK